MGTFFNPRDSSIFGTAVSIYNASWQRDGVLTRIGWLLPRSDPKRRDRL